MREPGADPFPGTLRGQCIRPALAGHVGAQRGQETCQGSHSCCRESFPTSELFDDTTPPPRLPGPESGKEFLGK